MIIERRKDGTMGRWGTIAEQQAFADLLAMWRPGISLTPLPALGYEPLCHCCNPALSNPNILKWLRPEGTITVTTPKTGMIFNVGQELQRYPDGMCDKMTPYGTEERVVIGTSHDLSMEALPQDLVIASLDACKERMRDLTQDPNFRNILFWGAGQVTHNGVPCHPQWHIESEATLFQRNAEELRAYKEYTFGQMEKERCMICDMLQQELGQKNRIIFETDSFLVFAPIASRYPLEAWIVPKKHQPYFETSADTRNLSAAIYFLFSRLQHTLQGYVPYTLVLHNAPLNAPGFTSNQLKDMFHWYLRFKPFMGILSITEERAREDAIAETINSLSPETAATILHREG